jgi:hypothetical protein
MKENEGKEMKRNENVRKGAVKCRVRVRVRVRVSSFASIF